MKPIVVLMACLMGLSFASAQACKEESGKVLRHIVCLKFNEDADKAAVEEALADFVALQDTIESIQDLEWGTNVSKEGHDKGFKYCFILTFRNEDGLNEYLPHHDHLALVEKVGPLLEDVMVVDIYVNP